MGGVAASPQRGGTAAIQVARGEYPLGVNTSSGCLSSPSIKPNRCDTVSRSSEMFPYAPDAPEWRHGSDCQNPRGRSHMRSSRTLFGPRGSCSERPRRFTRSTPQVPAAPGQNPAGPAPAGAPTAAPPAGDRPRAVPRGCGGGRGNPAAALYTETCSRSPWHRARGRPGAQPVRRGTDPCDRRRVLMAAIIANGIPNTEMVAFKATLNEAQIWYLVVYLRMQGANLKEKPLLVPDPQDIRSSRPRSRRSRFMSWRGTSRPPGPRVSCQMAGSPATERPGWLRIVERRGAAAGAGEEHAQGVGEAGL